jgi:hypothetical protein
MSSGIAWDFVGALIGTRVVVVHRVGRHNEMEGMKVRLDLLLARR